MSTLTLDSRESTLFGAQRGGESTLDELVVYAWEGLASARAIACPVCAGEMSPHVRVDAGELSGSCSDCGTELS